MSHPSTLRLRTLICVSCLIALQSAVVAQNSAVAAAAPVATADKQSSQRIAIMIAQWSRAKNWTLEYIAKMPEENFGFKPVPEVRSFAEQMLHLAYWNFGFTAKSFNRPLPYKEADLMKDDFKSKARLTQVVSESYDFVISGLKQIPDEQLEQKTVTGSGQTIRRIERLNDAYEHQTHHRGQTVVYLRLKGIEPPVEPF